jgi:hypothetical protein
VSKGAHKKPYPIQISEWLEIKRPPTKGQRSVMKSAVCSRDIIYPRRPPGMGIVMLGLSYYIPDLSLLDKVDNAGGGYFVGDTSEGADYHRQSSQ